MKTNRQLVEDYFDACTRGDAEAIARSFCDDAIVYDSNARPVAGADEIGRFFAEVREQRGNASWHIDTFVEGDTSAASEWTMIDRKGSEALVVRGSEHYEFRDGRISQIRQYWTHDPKGARTGLRDYPYEADPRFVKP